MKNVEYIIQREINNRDSFFVFPSEVVSSYWMRVGLDFGKKAVLSDRFLSWDRFKEKTFALNMNRIPVNRHIRTLFASSLLEENKKKGDLFKKIIRPEYSEGSKSFLSWIISILTEVKSFKENDLLRDIAFSDGIMDDLEFLYERYMDFLDDRGLFEPSWVKAKITDIGENYFLFFSETIEDFKDFVDDLEKSSVVHIINAENNSLRSIKQYNASTLELKSLLVEVGLLIDGGVRVQDIAITLPDMKGWGIPLKEEASLRSIPLDFRQGKRLSEYPGGRVFKIIFGCEKSGFSLSSMKQLLLNRSLPWKDRATAENLFQFGIEHHCLKNYKLRGQKIDVWKNTLIKSKKGKLLEFYQKLKLGIVKISSAKNFTELKSLVHIFISNFFDTSLWQAGTLGEFQFCLNSLGELEDAAFKAGEPDYGSAWDIWVSAIDDIIYVKRSETTGVKVFPYRVAAGTSWLWHFIPGLSHDVASVVKSKYMFLKDNQRQLFSELESDFTDPFLDLYNISGRNIIFSVSTDSFRGSVLPPSRFVLEKAVLLQESNTQILEDEYSLELGYWMGKNPLPVSIFPIMRKGVDFSIISAFKQKSVDFTKNSINISILQRLVTSRLINKEGNLHISPSSLDQFTNCPYLFLFYRGLDVSEDNYKEVYLDNLIFGQIIHECFDRFFRYVDSSTSKFSPSLVKEYKIEMTSIIDSVFNVYSTLGNDFIGPVWKYCREFTIDKLISFIEIEVVQFPEFKLLASEKKYTYLWGDRKVELSGRIDRVSLKDDKIAIIDYKKKNHFKKAGMKPDAGNPVTFQIPFYIYLLEKNGLQPGSASYYDVTNCKYDHVYKPEAKKSWCSEEEMAVLIDRLENSIESMDKRIKRGDYSVAPDGCTSCSFRRICRTKYHVR